jgi:hypothetical protein
MDEQPAGHNFGRPVVLDETKRRMIIALLMNGSSRRMAAGFVGCAPSTITRTAARDAEFAAQLARAEGNAETEALSLIRKAAHKERYWRAAAWLLERKNPSSNKRLACSKQLAFHLPFFLPLFPVSPFTFLTLILN